MSKQRATFAKLQRERDKKAKAEAKREQRLTGQPETDDTDVVEPEADQGAILDALAKLHEDYADGRMDMDEFEERKQDLTSRLAVG